MARITHGQSGSPIYPIWVAMRQRCSNSRHPMYKNYDGRGIKVCDQWDSSFERFLEDMGDRPPGLTIERIDNDGDYEPENCRWATQAEQKRNSRVNALFTHQGETLCLTDWARKVEMSPNTLRHRLTKLGYTLHEAITFPLGRWANHTRRPTNE